MRKLLFAVLTVGAMAAAASAVSTPAEAWGGCGIHRHPTPYGCRWNGGWGPGGVVVVGPGWGWRHRYWHRWHRW